MTTSNQKQIDLEKSGANMLIRLVLITYPILILAIAYLLVGDHSRTSQAQLSPHGYHTDKGEGLPDDERIAISRAKRWVEENLMGNAVSLDARYQVRRRNGAYEVHVVFVTGYSPTGSPLYVPKGHCVVGLDSFLEESETFIPREFEPFSEVVNGSSDRHSPFAHNHTGTQARSILSY